MKFLVQTGALNIPAQDYGYTVIRAVEELNWYYGENIHHVTNWRSTHFDPADLNTGTIPVGSVEFCLAWYRQMGKGLIRPLNIPEVLKPMLRRDLAEGTELPNMGRKWYGKDKNVIKASWNGVYSEYNGTHNMQFTAYDDSITAEWRCFVCEGEIADVRCYSGDPWLLPDKEYCTEAAKRLGETNPAFTLDVAVYMDGHTDIIECHDFFACGLYGFEDSQLLFKMLKHTQRHLLLTLPDTGEKAEMRRIR